MVLNRALHKGPDILGIQSQGFVIRFLHDLGLIYRLLTKLLEP